MDILHQSIVPWPCFVVVEMEVHALDFASQIPFQIVLGKVAISAGET